MNKQVEKEILKLYNQVWNKIFNKQNIKAASLGKSENLKNAIIKFQNSNQYKLFAKEFAKRLAIKGLNKEKGLWRKFYQAAKQSNSLGVLPDTYKEFELNIMKKAIKNNFELIKSIPSKVLEIYRHRYTEELIDEVARGKLTRGAFYRDLKEHGHRNAKVIARTESSKLQAVILENRATELGSVAYVWRSSNDKRTRPTHRAMNDVVVFWRPFEEKPLLDNMRGNAGEFPNCRCVALPIFHLDELNKSNYQVYDYRKNKIISMLRIDLINAIKNKGL